MIKAKQITIVDINEIIPHPKNNNKHPPEQIERLEKIIKYNGFRNPLIISNRSGFLIAGHARLEVAKKLGFEKLPIIFQDFENEAEEYQYLTADNEIAKWAELDKDAVIDTVKEFEDFDIELLGLSINLIDDFNDDDIDDIVKDKEKLFILEVTFPTETDLKAVENNLLNQGYIVKVK